LKEFFKKKYFIKMNHRVKKFMHLLIIEDKTNRKKLVDLWEKSSNIVIRCKYSLYVKEFYQDTKAKFPDFSRKQIMETLRREWKTTPEEDKIRFMVIEEKKPKKASPYNRFFKEKYAEIKLLKPRSNLPDMSREISALWKQLDENEKNKYLESDDNKYEKIKSAHEDKMVKPEEVAIINPDIKFDKEISEYFLKGLSKIPIEKIREEDPFLDLEEKNEILENCRYLGEKKTVSQLRKMYENNYDEELPTDISKDKILEMIYIHERKNKILSKMEDKQALIPGSFLIPNKTEKTALELKKDTLSKTEFWAVYLQFRQLFPEREGEDERPKEELIQDIMDFEEKKLVKEKTHQIIGIRV